MKHQHMCVGTCSKRIDFEIIDGKLHNVSFLGGCSGNTRGICALVEGMDASVAASRLRGIKCGNKPTSCPDQLSQAIIAATR